MAGNESDRYYVVHLTLHGLVRGQDLELGRDADTGGQIRYVLDLANALTESSQVDRVDVLTRQIFDKKVSDDYALPEEQLDSEGKGRIVRLPFGPKRYLRKEKLWPYLDSFVDQALRHFRHIGRIPDWIHAHYADAGLAGVRLAALLNVPLVFTGHSLGREKLRRLLETGKTFEAVDKTYSLSRRIEAEERALDMATLVIASTEQEAAEQYSNYSNARGLPIMVIPPGIDLSRFRPYRRGETLPEYRGNIERFLKNPRKPWILALARPDERKNFHGLLEAFGTSKWLREKANLVLIAGNRERVRALDKSARNTWREILCLIDDYDLYGQVAVPKHHRPEDVPDIYRLAAARGGVFVNPAYTEPFGLTLLEASASGLPIVATNDGGPVEIMKRLKNGVLVNPFDPEDIRLGLQMVLKDGKKWRTWSQRGVRWVRQNYSWEGHATQYLKKMKAILRHRKRLRTVPPKSRLPTVNRMIVCDIDNTLIGDTESLRRFIDLFLTHRDHIAFGVATGRQIHSALKVLKEWGVPDPDLLITAVGSEIYYDNQRGEDDAWKRRTSFRWDREKIVEALGSVSGLRLQPKSEQREHKVSYFSDLRTMPSLSQIRSILRKKGVHVNVIFSHNAFLDILPLRASKGLAVRFVADRWGIPIERVLVAGDSGNDAEMLTGENLGIVVGNYSSELEALKGDQHIYFANQSYAAGILEGIEHYDFMDVSNAEEDE